MDFFELILQLEDELGDKKGALFGKKVDVDLCRRLISEIRRSFPEVIKEAAVIVGERERYLNEARGIYDATLQEANRQASALVQQSALAKRAEEESRQMIEFTEARCRQMLESTKKMLDAAFADIEHFLMTALKMIQEKREKLWLSDGDKS